jgi:sn-glycerol 3-phosphate transport system ATP-binding protein
VFLFDEPLSNLDAKLRVQMRLEIKRLQRELGVTSIYVTHDQVEAMTLADRLIVMNAGVADQIGTPMDVYDRPASMFVAGFIGSPAMNFTAARVGADRTSVELTASSTRIVMPLGRQTSAKAGDLVTLGVRPEHLQPFQNGPVEFEIEMAEPLGADTLLHGKFGGDRSLITVRQSGHVIARPGERRRFNAEGRNLHLFEPDSGKRIADV